MVLPKWLFLELINPEQNTHSEYTGTKLRSQPVSETQTQRLHGL